MFEVAGRNIHLLHDLGSAEVALQAHAAGEAELAILRAADLRRYAQCRARPAGLWPLYGNDHCLYCSSGTITLHTAQCSALAAATKH